MTTILALLIRQMKNNLGNPFSSCFERKWPFSVLTRFRHVLKFITTIWIYLNGVIVDGYFNIVWYVFNLLSLPWNIRSLMVDMVFIYTLNVKTSASVFLLKIWQLSYKGRWSLFCSYIYSCNQLYVKLWRERQRQTEQYYI